jgi:hypothetical protein
MHLHIDNHLTRFEPDADYLKVPRKRPTQSFCSAFENRRVGCVKLLQRYSINQNDASQPYFVVILQSLCPTPQERRRPNEDFGGPSKELRLCF